MLNQLLKLPQLWVSSVIGYLVRIKLPLGLHRVIKKYFIQYYKVNTIETEFALKDYQTLGDFFIRKLKSNTRPIANTKIISPVDGIWTVFGSLSKSLLIEQIKGKNYSFVDLVDHQYNQERFENGFYSTIYLAPYHYHRVHSPIRGVVKSVTHIPGNLWPVNSWSVSKVENLFAVNERIIVEIESEQKSRCLVVMVGATNVGKMTLSFCSKIQGNTYQKRTRHLKMEKLVQLDVGGDLGCFHMGSTVILLFDNQYQKSDFTNLNQDFQTSNIKMGEALEF